MDGAGTAARSRSSATSPQLLCDRKGTCTARAGEDYPELLAADARRQIGFAHAVADHTRGPAQDVVARLMAEAIVDLLEVVEVEEDERERRLEAQRARDLLLQYLYEAAAIGEIGELVGHRLPPDD